MSVFDSQFDHARQGLNVHGGATVTYHTRAGDAKTVTARAQPLSVQPRRRESGESLENRRLFTIGRDADDTDFGGVANPSVNDVIEEADGTKWHVEAIENQSASETQLRCYRGPRSRRVEHQSIRRGQV